MADDVSLVHDAAALFRFVESIRRFCEVRDDYPAYSFASKKFLSFVQQLATATAKYLSDFPSNVPSISTDYPIYRQELFTLREGWSEIHRRVKPIADGDTLRVPSPLVNALVRRVQELNRFKSTKVAVLHTDRLNYLQVVASRIRGTADDIAQLVNAPSFPSDLGLIGIPYSQSDSIFMNCLIAHELGHFVFGELGLTDILNSKAQAILTNIFKPVASSLNADDRKRMPSLFANWTEELFCDLFAVRLIGPCYTYAFVEITDLTNILNLDGSLNKSAATSSFVFYDSHPAELYRVRIQTNLLEHLGWWEEINTSKSHVTRVLESSLTLPAEAFAVPSLKIVELKAMEALEQIVTEIRAALDKALSGLESGVGEYAHLKSVVREYFLHGVIPSMVPVTGEKTRKSPTSVTIVNVAYQIYLDSLSELINRIENQDPLSVVDSARWTQKLETWTLKALDDLAGCGKIVSSERFPL